MEVSRNEEMHRRFKQDVKDVFSTDPGKRVLLHLADKYSVFDAMSVGQMERSTPQLMAYREGSRQVIMDLLRAVNENVIEYRADLAQLKELQRRG